MRTGLFAFILAIPYLIHSQTLRCDLASSTVINGNTTTQCLTPEKLKGQVITLPRNVTRINQDGLSICRQAFQAVSATDIVFVVDQSSSMRASTAKVVNGDTSYCPGTYNNAGTTQTMVIPIFQRSPTGGVLSQDSGASWSLKALTVTTNASATCSFAPAGYGMEFSSGDPHSMRGRAIRVAIDYIASTSPISRAGYLGFGNDNVDMQQPIPMTTANATVLKSRTLLRELANTNYIPALTQAKVWLNDPALSPNGNPAIIFISDGAPNDAPNVNLGSPLIQGMPPVYSIFMAKNSTAAATVMQNLSTNSGGKFYFIPPNNLDSLNRVIVSILNHLQDLNPPERTPLGLSITNSSFAPNQNVTSTGFTSTSSGWVVALNDLLPLRPNMDNTVRIVSQFSDTAGVQYADTSDFILRTTAAVATGNSMAGSDFTLRCGPPSRLVWQAVGTNAPPAGGYFTENHTQVILQLMNRGRPLGTTQVNLGTRNSPQDIEIGNLPFDFAFPNSDSVRYVGSVPLFRQSSSIQNNNFLNPQYYDTLTARWVHPRDAQDSAVAWIPYRPASRQATAFFSNDGSNGTNQIPASAESFYIIVTDQILPSTPQIRIISISSEGLGRDTLWVSATLDIASVRYTGVVNRGTGQNELDVQNGDLLTGRYIDPVDGDQVFAAAGFGATVSLQGGPRRFPTGFQPSLYWKGKTVRLDGRAEENNFLTSP